MAGISVICFVASYAAALGLELTRLMFRSAVRGALLLGFAGAGLLAHTLFLYYRAVAVHGSPLSSEHDWYLLTAWFVAAVYLGLTWWKRSTPFGLFLLPLVLGLIATAVLLADPAPYAREPASQVWGAIHGLAVLFGFVAVLVGFAAGAMYLYQSRRLKNPAAGRGLRLPSLEWLAGATARAIVAAVVFLSVGVLAGLLLNVINQDRLSRLSWRDPLVLSTLLTLGWLTTAVVAGGFYRPARQGRKVALLTMVSFVFLAVTMAMGLFAWTEHGQPRRSIPSVERPAGQPAPRPAGVPGGPA